MKTTTSSLLFVGSSLLAISYSHAAVLIDRTFDNVANDIGPSFQQVSNGSGSANLITGLISTAANTTSAAGFNVVSTLNVNALDPSATGVRISFAVSGTIANVSALANNGLFFGVVSGTDATGTAGPSLWNNNPHAFGWVAGSGPTTAFGYGVNVMRQDAQGGASNDAYSVTTPLGTPPTDLSFQDGFSVTIELFNNDTWSIATTGLSSNLSSSGILKTTGTGMFGYAGIVNNMAPFVSLQGQAAATLDVDRITVVSIPEPSSILLVGLAGLGLFVRRR